MKLVCRQEDLHRALAVVSRAVATRTALPVLSNVLLDAEGDLLKIAATNMEIGIATGIPADISTPGKITVDARLLADFVNALPAGNVALTADLSRFSILVESGRDTATINGLDPEDFPVIASLSPDTPALSLDPQVIREMISQVEFTAASEESRPVLAGVLIRFTGDRLVLAAADGFRLSVREDRMLTPFDENLDVIIPARAVRELARILGEAKEPFQIQITPSHSQFLARVGDTEFVSRMVDGAFPDYQRIIPRDFSTVVTVDRDTLLNAVKRSSFFARDSNDVLKMTVNSDETSDEPGTIEVSATAAERGSNQSVIDAGISGPSMKIGFNTRFLHDVLAALKSEQAEVSMNGQNQAAVIRSPGDESYTNVIMPMMIGS